MSKQIDFNNLTYYFKDYNIAPVNSISFKVPLNVYNDTKNSSVSIEKIEEDQKQFKSKLNEITTGNPKYKLKDQFDGIEKIKNLCNSREKVKYNKLNISATTWNEEFKLPDGSYSLSDIQDYFEYILKKTWRKY